MLLSEKITLIISIWILFIFIITDDTNLEIFLILIIIGILIIRELTEKFSSINLKERLNIIIYFFLIIFIVFVGKRIIEII